MSGLPYRFERVQRNAQIMECVIGFSRAVNAAEHSQPVLQRHFDGGALSGSSRRILVPESGNKDLEHTRFVKFVFSEWQKRTCTWIPLAHAAGRLQPARH